MSLLTRLHVGLRFEVKINGQWSRTFVVMGVHSTAVRFIMESQPWEAERALTLTEWKTKRHQRRIRYVPTWADKVPGT